ncbi:MAG: 16S rRNA (cytidine(1402)-2'-O)-methyltransferase, partial [Candidatus Polarisedimenticolia bacterium]
MDRPGPAPPGTLYVVATPIGNLEDLSPRARAALAASPIVACEDTRTTGGLLRRAGLRSRLVSCHRFNERARIEPILEALGRGDNVALVSDAGAPGVSDPGALLVRAARAAGHRVVPIPGPSAVTTLLMASGFPPGPFTFVGFLPPRAGERCRALETLRGETRPLLLFEAPHRLARTLQDALRILGDRDAFVGREMTKFHEEFLEGPLSAIRSAFEAREPRGEIALLIAGAPEGGTGSAGGAVVTIPGEDQVPIDVA